MYAIEYHEAVLSTFKAFLAALDKLCLHIHDELTGYPVWIDNGKDEFIDSRDKVIYVLKHITPSMHLSPQETFSCPGAVGASNETVDLIDRVNYAKDTFKLAVQSYITSANGNPTKPARQILASAGYGGIKLLQVYRHLPYIKFHPRRIAWTKSKKGGHVIINPTQAKEKLLKAGQGEHIDTQLAKLSLLRSPNDKLVIYRQLKTCWGINVATFKDEDGHSITHRIREESLPLFYCHDKTLPIPIVCFSKKTNRNVEVRSDKQLENLPFLKSIHAHRYKTRIKVK